MALHHRRVEDEEPFLEYRQIVTARDDVINRFQPVFADVSQLTQAEFRAFLKFENNQHWTGLHRPTKHSADDMERVRNALAYLFDESIPIQSRLDQLTSKSDISVPGVNMAILTALLLVRYPDKYGVWNGKSKSALVALKVWPEFRRGTTDGQKYAKLNAFYNRLAEEMPIDLWSLDGLWHVINELAKNGRDEAFSHIESETYREGRRVDSSSYRIERNAKAREKCIEKHGDDCAVCGFNFLDHYGEIGIGFIHVHHRDDLATAESEIEVDPKKNLIPVCPNCHAMLHRGAKPSRSIDELKSIMANWQSQDDTGRSS